MSIDNNDDVYTSLIQQYLSLLLYENAIFLSERYASTNPKSLHANYLLATCYYKSGQIKKAMHVLQNLSYNTSDEKILQSCTYLLSKCYYDLGEYKKAEDTLLNSKKNKLLLRKIIQSLEEDDSVVEELNGIVPNGAAGYYLLGCICRKTYRIDLSCDYFRISLKLDPLMFVSYEALCEMGITIDPISIFGVVPNESNKEQTTGDKKCPTTFLVSSPANETKDDKLLSMVDMSYSTPPNATDTTPPRYNPPPLSRLRHSSSRFYSPELTPIQPSDTNHGTKRSRQSSPYILNRARTVVSRLYYEPTPDCIPHHNITTLATTKDDHHTTIAESSTIAFDVSGCGSEIGAFFTNLGTTDYKKSNRYIEDKHDILAIEDKQENNQDTIQEILSVLCIIGAGIQQLSQYKCKEAISTFNTLPSHHLHTGYIQYHMGKAYFEMADYSNAKDTLYYMSKLEPYRLQGLDILSTTLWHLKNEVELCSLAQRVVSIDKLSPYTWVVVGNCFSLQKEHESALLFFKRSIQLDKYFTYAYTLSGHEYVSNEDLENATSSFRNALRIDARHYTAWYGLGNIYFRQEKYDLATLHFQKALCIHPTSSILLCYLATSQYSNQQIHAALQTLDDAISTTMQNPQVRFQRATIYIALNRYHEALLELEAVKNIVPRESSVYFCMGKVYKKLNLVEKAMRCFLIALDLDPKDHNLIKSHMEKLDCEEEFGEEGIVMS